MLSFTSTSSQSQSQSKSMGRSLGALLSLALLAATSTQATYTCDTSLGTYYPYCINVPDNAQGKLPAILFLSGSGARGDASNVKSLSGYDGFGKLINDYRSGNKGAAQTMAAEQFVTIIPISPKSVNGQEIRHWMPENVNKVIEAVKGKYGDKVDWGSLHLSGYSMGSRGVFRNAVANPGMYASLAPSAGAAEASGDGTLTQQKAPSVFDKLSAISSLPIWQFDGAWDTTAGTESPKRTQAELEKLGAGDKAKLTTIQCDHSGLSTKPFTVELMQWMLKQGGGSSSSSASSSTSSDVVEDVSIATSTSSASGSKNTTSTSTSTRCKSSSAAARKAKRSEGYAFAHAGPVRRGVYSAPHMQKQKRGLSLAAILAGRTSSSSSAAQKRDQIPVIPGQGAIPLHAAFAGNNGQSYVPTTVETVVEKVAEEESRAAADPALVARQALRQSAASRVGKRMSR